MTSEFVPKRTIFSFIVSITNHEGVLLLGCPIRSGVDLSVMETSKWIAQMIYVSRRIRQWHDNDSFIVSRSRWQHIFLDVLQEHCKRNWRRNGWVSFRGTGERHFRKWIELQQPRGTCSRFPSNFGKRISRGLININFMHCTGGNNDCRVTYGPLTVITRTLESKISAILSKQAQQPLGEEGNRLETSVVYPWKWFPKFFAKTHVIRSAIYYINILHVQHAV